MRGWFQYSLVFSGAYMLWVMSRDAGVTARDMEIILPVMLARHQALSVALFIASRSSSFNA